MSATKKVSIAYFIALLTFIIVRILNVKGILSFWHDWDAEIWFTLIIQLGCMVMIPLGIALLFSAKGEHKSVFRLLSFRKIGFKVIIISILLGILAYFLNMCISSLWSGVLSFFNYSPRTGGKGASSTVYDTFGKFLLGTILVAVTPGLCEEFLHRGLMLGGLSKGMKKWQALLLSSIFFGLIHLNIYQTVYATFLGMLMGFLVVISGSILPAMIIHFMNNFINVYASYVEEIDGFGAGLSDFIASMAETNFFLTFIMISLFLLFVIISFVMLIIKLFEISKDKYAPVQDGVILLENPYFYQEEEIVSQKENIIKSQIEEEYIADLTQTLKALSKHKNVFAMFIINRKGVVRIMCYPDNLVSRTRLTSTKKLLKEIFKEEDSQKVKAKFGEKIFLYGSLLLGTIVTIFTFIWGVI